MPSFLASYRHTGVLRRLSVTPVHPALVLLAQVVVSLVQSVIGVLLALGLAVAFFDASFPRDVLGAIGMFLLVAAAMYALGTLVAAISPTTNSSIAIGLVLFFAMLAAGGGFGSRENLPTWLATIGGYLPFGAGLDALSAMWIGAAPELQQIAVLAGTTVLAGVAAVKLFRWT